MANQSCRFRIAEEQESGRQGRRRSNQDPQRPLGLAVMGMEGPPRSQCGLAAVVAKARVQDPDPPSDFSQAPAAAARDAISRIVLPERTVECRGNPGRGLHPSRRWLGKSLSKREPVAHKLIWTGTIVPGDPGRTPTLRPGSGRGTTRGNPRPAGDRWTRRGSILRQPVSTAPKPGPGNVPNQGQNGVVIPSGRCWQREEHQGDRRDRRTSAGGTVPGTS